MTDKRLTQSSPVEPSREHADTRMVNLSGTYGAVEAWLKKSREAQDSLTALEYLQRASELNPDDPHVQAGFQDILQNRLKHDPYVAFLAQTDTHYVVTFRHSPPVLLPKARAVPGLSQPAQRTEGERLLGMVWWIVLGFLFFGAGALVASLLVLQRAWGALRRRDLDARERRLAWLTVGLATALGLVGEFFTLLLVLHFLG